MGSETHGFPSASLTHHDISYMCGRIQRTIVFVNIIIHRRSAQPEPSDGDVGDDDDDNDYNNDNNDDDVMMMMMLICDLIRLEAACGFPMVATACQGLGSAIANCGLNLCYQSCHHHHHHNDNNVHNDHDDYQTFSMILVLMDIDDAEC